MSLEATLENIIAELLERSNEARRAEFDARKAEEKAIELRANVDACRKVIGETFKLKTGERRIVFHRNLVTIDALGYVTVQNIEHIK